MNVIGLNDMKLRSDYVYDATQKTDIGTAISNLNNAISDLNNSIASLNTKLASKVEFPNNTLVLVGDDVKIGDQNIAGTLIVQGNNGDGNVEVRRTNGTKITSILDLNNSIASVNNKTSLLVKTYWVNTQANTQCISYTAPSISNYSFICWLGVTSNGFVGTPYLNPYGSASTQIWDRNISYSSSNTYSLCALYQHN